MCQINFLIKPNLHRFSGIFVGHLSDFALYFKIFNQRLVLFVDPEQLLRPAVPGHPQKMMAGDQWWARYQPVRYEEIHGLGSEQDLRNCCKACEKAGLLVFGDLVFNHMQARSLVFGCLFKALQSPEKRSLDSEKIMCGHTLKALLHFVFQSLVLLDNFSEFFLKRWLRAAKNGGKPNTMMG